MIHVVNSHREIREDMWRSSADEKRPLFQILSSNDHEFEHIEVKTFGGLQIHRPGIQEDTGIEGNQGPRPNKMEV